MNQRWTCQRTVVHAIGQLRHNTHGPTGLQWTCQSWSWNILQNSDTEISVKIPERCFMIQIRNIYEIISDILNSCHEHKRNSSDIGTSYNRDILRRSSFQNSRTFEFGSLYLYVTIQISVTAFWGQRSAEWNGPEQDPRPVTSGRSFAWTRQTAEVADDDSHLDRMGPQPSISTQDFRELRSKPWLGINWSSNLSFITEFQDALQ